MSCTKQSFFFTCFLFYLIPQLNRAQDNLVGYWNPQVAINYDVSPNYSHNFSFENRSYLYRDSDVQLSIRQLDFNHFSGLKISDNQSIGFGIKYRIKESFDANAENELRFTQQYNINFKDGSVRFGNRFRAQQRITTSSTVHRFRYRFATDFPLKGEQLDIGEPYLVISTESLLSIGKSMTPEYDQRVTSKIGWVLNSSTKLQLGGEYRAENYTNSVENELYFLTELVLSL